MKVHFIIWSAIWIFRIISAIVFSFFLFTGVALLHASFGIGNQSKILQARQISTTEFVKKPPPEKKIIQQRVRQVNQNTTKGKSEGSRIAMRITPDLAVDGPDNGNGAVVTKQEVKAEVFEEGQVDEPAVAILKTPLKYPERARELGIEGALQVEFIVSHQGKVIDIQIISSPSPDITAEARRTIATWKFKPAKNKGIPVNMRFRQVIDFKLD